MENGKKAAIGATVVLLLAGGIRVGMIYRERNAPSPAAVAPERAKLPEDAYVFLKKKRPSSLADLKDLYGTTVWMSAGGQLEYYPVSGTHVEYARKAGTLLGAEPLQIVGAVEQVAPKAATFRVPGGDRQVLLTFRLPPSVQGPGEGKKLFAVPVGYREGGQYTFVTDELFFYDDPHGLYAHWGPKVWDAVDHHTAIPGMSEAQVQMALGQVSDSGSQDLGNRTVTYNNLGHPIDVTFVKERATAITPGR